MSASSIPAPGRVLGIDLGSRRIGVAACDSGQSLATGVTMVPRSRDRHSDHRALAALVVEYEAVGAVVGLPLSLDGGQGPAARGVVDELTDLATTLSVPVETIDERLTTVSATAALRAGGRDVRRARQVVDQVAAAVLLQSWLDRRAACR